MQLKEPIKDGDTRRRGEVVNYPRGKLNERDEGELQIRLGPTPDGRAFVIDFGKPITWFGLGPAEARALAEKLLAYAAAHGGTVDPG